MNIMLEIRRELEKMAEGEYQQFSTGLIPGAEHMLGVRLPALREQAKQIARMEPSIWQEYLTSEPYYFEETMLQGMIIGAVDVPVGIRLGYVKQFVPRIDNWSVCDSFCSSLKFVNQNREAVWEFLQPYAKSDEEFCIRFAVVMMMNDYLTEEYIHQVLSILDTIRHPAYYVKMAVAWALATALAKQPEKTWDYFQNHHLDEDTWKKTIRKCIESRRIPEEQKQILREMR